MNIAMINNLGLKELERHTQQLLDEGDYGPAVTTTLKQWIDMKVDADRIVVLEKVIEHLKGQLDQIKDFVADQ